MRLVLSVFNLGRVDMVVEMINKQLVVSQYKVALLIEKERINFIERESQDVGYDG